MTQALRMNILDSSLMITGATLTQLPQQNKRQQDSMSLRQTIIRHDPGQSPVEGGRVPNTSR